MPDPYFSIVVSAYNRASIIRRCVDSCLNQTFDDFEVVVVDDASTDDTLAVLQAIADPRLTIVAHVVNKGICPARHTGMHHARGRWLVALDSDHGLMPTALADLYRRTINAPLDIGAVGSRYRWDTGRITPAFVPPAVIDYKGRIRWADEEGGSDYLFCARREIYETVSWPSDRRGPLDMLFQLDFAFRWKARIDEDIIAIEYSDAANSQTRSKGSTRAMIFLQNAPDMAWHYEEVLRLHGEALRKWGPRQFQACHRAAALNHFLAGQRRSGWRRILQYLRMRPASVAAWGILVLGTINPTVLAWANAQKNR